MSIEEIMIQWESTCKQVGLQLQLIFRWNHSQRIEFNSKLYEAGKPFVLSGQIFDYGINQETMEPIIYPHNTSLN